MRITRADLLIALFAEFGRDVLGVDAPPARDGTISADVQHHAGHDCPNPDCSGGTGFCETGYPSTQHTHRCPLCGCLWQHGPGGAVAEEYQ